MTSGPKLISHFVSCKKIQCAAPPEGGRGRERGRGRGRSQPSEASEDASSFQTAHGKAHIYYFLKFTPNNILFDISYRDKKRKRKSERNITSF
jgi:hypothetical protein